MAVYPYYDECVLPTIVHPFTTIIEEPRKYLGNTAVTKNRYLTINFSAIDNDSIAALNSFWVNECNYGKDPFVVSMPLFGKKSNSGTPSGFLVKFIEQIENSKDDYTWKSSTKLRIINEVLLSTDGNGDIIIDNTGGIEILGNVDENNSTNISTYRRVIFGAPTVDEGNAFPIPIYDEDVLPKAILPLTDTRELPSRYIGGRRVTMGMSTKVKLQSTNNDEVVALEEFWRTSCNYGLEPFIMKLPVFGRGTSVDLLVKFVGDISDTVEGFVWNSTRSLDILGELSYNTDSIGYFILDTLGHFTFDAAGNYIAVMGNVHIFKEIV